ncbi:hypothetical protein THRCLA_04301 [Thraustotheca clavata]|uniref:Major Facilitator Superfamily (MFS) n=1 Tax=Thraustotheca clavata TaxID=74557 RepID=A0A1V9ZZF7_9STRA|nr:hypothetical protein THRCLA_04301 [Thraustotheca clavata]
MTGMSEKNNSIAAWALVALVLFSNLFFAGFIFGWASLLILLQQENQYNELCDQVNSDTGRCAAQDSHLSIIYGFAQFALTFSSLPTGIILDKLGPKKMSGIIGIVITIAFVLLALSDSKSFDAFVYGYCLIGISGGATLLTSLRSGFVIMEWQTAIFAGINCLFDASAVMTSLLYEIHNATGISRKGLLLGYAAIAVLTYIALVVLWGIVERQEKKSNDVENSEENNVAAVNDTESPLYESLDNPSLHEATLKTQYLSFEFRYLLLFTALHNLQSSFYFGTVNQTMINYNDTTQVYTKVFGWILPAGFIFIPVINTLVDRFGLPYSMFATTLLSIVYHGVAMIPSLQLQVLTFVLFTAFRAIFYANASTCGATTFGHANMGTIIGTVYTGAAVVALLEIPAAKYANTSKTGWNLMYGISLVLAVCMLPVIEIYRRRFYKI